MGKPAAPDLAWEQDYLRTMDPALGRPAPERLPATLDLMKGMRNMQVAPGSASAPWVERGPNNVGGRTRALVYDPNDLNVKKVWAAGVTGGLWFNNDITSSASSWNPVNNFWENIAVSCIAFDPNNSQIMYVGTGEGFGVGSSRGAGIWKSTNGGTTWSQLTSTVNFYYVNDIVVRNESGVSTLYAAVDGGYYNGVWHGSNQAGIQRSVNGGTSWSNVSPLVAGSKLVAADLELAANGRIWVGSKAYPFSSTDRGGGRVYYSDNGTSYTLSQSITVTNGKGRVELACAPSNSNVVYAVFENNNQVADIKKTSNGGTVWTSISEPADVDNGIPDTDFTRGQAWYDLIMAVDPNNADNVIVGGIDLFRSVDGGSNWTQISKWSNNNNLGNLNCSEVHADQHAIVFKPGNSSTLIFGNDGGVFYTSNIGSAGTSDVIFPRNNNYNVTQYYSCAINPTSGSNNMLAGAQDNGTQRYNVAGMNSTTEVYGGDGAYCFIDQNNASHQIASYVYNSYYLSRNTGNSFLTTLIDDDQTGKFINPADYDDANDVLYASRTIGTIYRVRQVTGTPQTPEVVNISGMADEASHIRVSPYSGAVFVGTDVGEVYKVSNPAGTSSSTEIGGSSLPSGSISCIEIGGNDNELLVTFFNYGVTSVWYTNNGGSSWTNKEGNLPDMPIRWALFNPNNRNEVILATELGVWASSNFLSTTPSWTASNQGMANVRVDMLQIRSSDNMVIAATYGRGLFSSLAFSLSNPPQVMFAANKLTPCLNDTVTLTDTATIAASSYQWTITPNTFVFTGGTNANSRNCKVLFTTNGFYTIKLKVSNAAGSDSVTKTNYIKAGGQSLPFSENWENSSTYSGWFLANPDGKTTWSIYTVSGNGSGTKAAGIDNFNYSDAGSAILRDGLISPPINLQGYSSVTLSFKHAYKRFDPSAMDSLAIYVSTTCGSTWTRVASFRETQASSPYNFITGADLGSDFFPSTTSDWCGGSSNYATCKTVNLTAFAGGDVKLKFENISGYGNNLFIDDILITGVASIPAPVVNFRASNLSPCANTTVNFTDSSTNTPSAWEWTFTPNTVSYVNGTSSNVKNPQVQFLGGGAYTVSLKATNAGGANTLTKNAYINVTNSVTPQISINIPNSTLCAGENAVFSTVILNGGSNPTYQWKNNGANVGTNNNAYTSAGLNNNDTIWCVFNSNASCAIPAIVESNKIVVNIKPKPTVTFTLSNNKLCVRDTTVVLSEGLPSGGVYSGTGVSNGNFNPSISGAGNHVITYTYTDASSCAAAASANMQVSSLANAPVITQNGNTLSCDISGALTYQWFKENVAISGANAQTYDITSSGNYQVEVSLTGGCSRRSLVYNIIKTRIDELRSIKALAVYPIPAHTEITLAFESTKAQSLSLYIYDMTGKLVWQGSEEVVVGAIQLPINVSTLAPGTYLLRISNEGKQIQRNLLVK